MVDEPRFSEKWDFRRQENNYDDDSSSDDPDSNSTHEPIIHNTNPVLHSNQLDNGTETVTTTEQPVKTRKRRSKKDDSKPEKAKQVRRRKPKTVCAEENTKKEETVMETDEVGMFMKTLLDDLTASRESLMDWMNTELCGSADQNVVSRPPPKKRAVAAVSVKKRRPKKKGEEEKETEKQRKQGEICLEMNKTKEKSSEVVQNGGDQAQELDYDVGPLDTILRSGHEQGQQDITAQTEIENATEMNNKSVVLAIAAPKLRQRQKKTREGNTIKNISETKRDDNFAIPYVPQLSSSPLFQSFPVGSPLFTSSSQGVACLASNNNYQPMQPPVVPQFSELSEFQTGFTGGQGFGNSLFHNDGYFSGFPAASQPDLAQVNHTTYSQQRDNNNMFGGLPMNPTTYSQQRDSNNTFGGLQMNPTTYSQQRDDNNMFGELQMAGGAIPYSGSRFEVSNGNNSLSNYRTSSGR
ncbi:Stress response NST1-like protein [Hirschfeldia incana]|nr:Stress response NST1-like protein [Hirschfeldia incana]